MYRRTEAKRTKYVADYLELLALLKDVPEAEAVRLFLNNDVDGLYAFSKQFTLANPFGANPENETYTRYTFKIASYLLMAAAKVYKENNVQEYLHKSVFLYRLFEEFCVMFRTSFDSESQEN